MYNFSADSMCLLRNSQREQGAAASGSYNQKILIGDSRFGDLSHIVGFDSQMRQSLADSLQGEKYSSDSYEVNLVCFQNCLYEFFNRFRFYGSQSLVQLTQD